MKTFTSYFALLATPAILATSYADDTPGALTGLLPYDGSLLQGAAVRAVIDPSLAEMNQAIVKNYNALPKEKKKEYQKTFDPDKAMVYDDGIFGDKATYEKYLAARKKTKVEAATVVALGLRPSSEPGVWTLISATVDASGKTLPLTIGALKYDAKKNVWISNNGTLDAEPFSADDTFAFGPQSGTQWTYKHTDALSNITEQVRVAKTTDGEFLFVSYRFLETSAVSDSVIAQGSYMLRFPVVTKKAGLSKPGQK